MWPKLCSYHKCRIILRCNRLHQFMLLTVKVVSHLDMDEMDENDLNSASTTFMAIDSHLYRPISVTDTKHKVYDFAPDKKDEFVAVLEVRTRKWMIRPAEC